jgi:hypothetical protein
VRDSLRIRFEPAHPALHARTRALERGQIDSDIGNGCDLGHVRLLVWPELSAVRSHLLSLAAI